MSTLTTEKHYNTTMLRKLRDEVTSTLKDAGFQIPGNCKISGINELAVHLTIELILKSGNDLGKKQKDTEIKKALTAKYCENIVITNVSSTSTLTYRIDLTKEYEARVALLEIPENNQKLVEKKEEKAGSNNKSLTAYLQETLIKLLSDSTNLRQGKGLTGYTIEPHKDGEELIIFNFNSAHGLSEAVLCFEFEYADRIKIINFFGNLWSFSVSLKPCKFGVSEKANRSTAYDFMTNFKKGIAEVNKDAKVVTSYLLLDLNMTHANIEIRFRNSGDAASTAALLKKAFSVVKEDGVTVNVSIIISNQLKYSKEPLVLNQPADKPYVPKKSEHFSNAGLVPVNKNKAIKKEKEEEPDDVKGWARPILPLTDEMLDRELKDGMTLRRYLSEHCTIMSKGDLISVYWTSVYEYRSIILENRDIKGPKVKALEASYINPNEGQLFSVIYLNELLEEIEGQHRIEASLKTQLGFYFVIMVGWGLPEVKILNANLHAWTPVDRMESFAKEGNPNYVLFKQFFEAHEFNISICQILLTNQRIRRKRGGNKYDIMEDEFLSGRTQITEEQVKIGEDRVKKIKQFEKYHPEGWKSRSFIESMVKIFLFEGFDFNHLIGCFKKDPDTVLMEASVQKSEFYIKTIVKIYNDGKPKVKLVIPEN